MLVLVIITLLLSALFSGVEMAFVSSDSVRVKLDVNRGGIINRILNRYYSSSELFITTILVGNNVVLVVYGMAMGAILTKPLAAHFSSEALLLAVQTLISTGIILITGEFLPKSIFRVNPNAMLRVFALPIYIFYLVLYPISAFTAWLSHLLMRMAGISRAPRMSPFLSLGDLNRYIEKNIDPDSVHPHTSVAEEVKMFHNALDFSKTHLRDCMIPRNELVAVNIDSTSRDDLVSLFTATGRSKIIVYREDIDNVLGYIHVSELFDPAVVWTERIKPVLFVPETLLANKLMRRLLSEKRSMAIVVDEFGGTSGLVTLEDLVEEIFGDIRDEHDTTDTFARRLPDGAYEFSGRIEVETLRETYHLDIPDDDEYQTLAGYILFSTGRLPDAGEPIDIASLRFTVVKRSATRLELIKVEPATSTSPAADA